ncbi:MAG TPA: alpha/beta hydrolase-fold protein [Gemmatimonadaceae bacterium]|nr:alpha/beta hydrolase-fold protein [Gemmatimonadaceae bacterium]
MPNSAELRLHTRFKPAQLGATRTLAVLLPPGYERERLRRYPVLYLQDGQNLFAATSPLSQDWRLDETVPALIDAGAIEPVIVAGLFHAGEQRIDELTPTRDAREKRGGGAERYERALLEDVLPFMAAHYRVRSGAGAYGIGGSSLGGLTALWIALRHPDVFGRVAALSPSAWWDRRRIVRQVRALPARSALRVWLSVGTSEGRTGAPAVRALRDAMLGKGWMLGRDLRYHEASGAGHDEHAWAALVEPALRFLHPARREPHDLGGLERL